MKRAAQPELETARLLLRAYRTEDAAALHAAFGDPVAMRYWDSPPTRSPEATARYLRFALSCRPLRYVVWIITRARDGEVLGMINYHNRVPGSRRMTLGWIMVPGHAGQGYMSEAARGVIGYCIARLHVNRFEAMIEPENAASRALAERLGFICESGVLRERMLVAGEYRNVLLYGLLARDFRG